MRKVAPLQCACGSLTLQLQQIQATASAARLQQLIVLLMSTVVSIRPETCCRMLGVLWKLRLVRCAETMGFDVYRDWYNFLGIQAALPTELREQLTQAPGTLSQV